MSEDTGLPTRAAPRSPTPSPTTDLAALVVTVRPIPTRTPGPPETATPPLVPPNTSTPRPTATMPGGSFPNPTFLTTPRVPPTRTPAPRGTFTGPVDGLPTPEPEPRPFDPNEPNDTPARATRIDPNPIEAAIGGFDDVDVYRVDVSQPNVLLVITLTGEQMTRYKVDVVAPRSGAVGRQRFDGTVALRALADVGLETGTYFVYVRGVGRELPKGPYFISADVTTPAVTPTTTAESG